MDAKTLAATFAANAQKVSATVSTVASLDEAFGYAVDLCDRKETCRLLVSGCEAPLSPQAGDLCDTKQQKLMAAPGLNAWQAARLADRCQARGIVLAGIGLRRHLAGIDIGLTVVDYGIAETGTLVLDCASEDLRLATMISEIHIAVLPLSRLRFSSRDLADELRAIMAQAPDYLAFITGASRTADIERVLALGVHGPLELHILLWEDQ